MREHSQHARKRVFRATVPGSLAARSDHQSAIPPASPAGDRAHCGPPFRAYDRAAPQPEGNRSPAMPDAQIPSRRRVPEAIEERLIVALDVPTIAEARALVARLDGIVSFFKLGLWLVFAEGFDALLAEILRRDKKVFLDSKMFDIGETVRQGVARAAERGVRFVTVHGNRDIIRAAVEGKGNSELQILAITVLTSFDDSGLAELGYAKSVAELIAERVDAVVACGCDGIIAAPRDDADAIRRAANAPNLLVVTPGIRLAGTASDDHRRAGTPAQAIASGADYLVVGRPIVRHADPAAEALRIIADMRSAG
jgi:orotidine-5'-phosphate decarboxylase